MGYVFLPPRGPTTLVTPLQPAITYFTGDPPIVGGRPMYSGGSRRSCWGRRRRGSGMSLIPVPILGVKCPQNRRNSYSTQQAADTNGIRESFLSLDLFSLDQTPVIGSRSRARHARGLSPPKHDTLGSPVPLALDLRCPFQIDWTPALVKS